MQADTLIRTYRTGMAASLIAWALRIAMAVAAGWMLAEGAVRTYASLGGYASPFFLLWGPAELIAGVAVTAAAVTVRA